MIVTVLCLYVNTSPQMSTQFNT